MATLLETVRQVLRDHTQMVRVLRGKTMLTETGLQRDHCLPGCRRPEQVSVVAVGLNLQFLPSTFKPTRPSA